MVFQQNISASLFFLGIALALSAFLFIRSATQPWHEGPKWTRYLEVYDSLIEKKYPDCEKKLIPTRFGSTQSYACGSISKPPVLLLPGSGGNSLMYSDWLVPAMRNSYYVVAVDYVCDVGRSIPKDKSLSNCPKTQQDLAEWVSDIVTGLGFLSQPKVSLVGYSYGSFIAASTASAKPNLVDKLVLMAPPVFAPMKFSWIWRGILYSMFPCYLDQWFFKYISADPQDFDVTAMYNMDHRMRTATCQVGFLFRAADCKEQFPDAQLLAITSSHPTLVMIGAEEKLLNTTLAAETAKRTGSQVEIFPKAGHLFALEYPQKSAISLVLSFLQSSTST